MILADADAKTVFCNIISLKIFGTRGPCLLTMWPIFVELIPFTQLCRIFFFYFQRKAFVKNREDQGVSFDSAGVQKPGQTIYLLLYSD